MTRQDSNTVDTFGRKLSRAYADMSPRLQQAARFVSEHPLDVATRSLRVISKDADLAPATFSRMARAAGYSTYEDLREEMRVTVGQRATSFSSRAEKLQIEHADNSGKFAPAHLAACSHNLQALENSIDMPGLERLVERLHTARRVLLTGALGSTGVIEYLAYMGKFFNDNWHMAGKGGSSLGSELIGLSAKDVLIVVTKPPFSTGSVRAAKLASEQGAFVAVITDTPACPALSYASGHFLVETDSPHFFSSYAATLVLAEVIIGMLVSRAGPTARNRIAEVEQQNHHLSEVVSI